MCLLLLTVWQGKRQEQALNTTDVIAICTKRSFPENVLIFSPTDERDFEDFFLDFEEDLKAHHSVQCSPSPGMKLPARQESKHNITGYSRCRTKL